jgi:hypothetical protein
VARCEGKFTISAWESGRCLDNELTVQHSVSSYSPSSGVLTLEHRLPEETHSTSALVDVTLVLESLGEEQTRVGEWVNVIGYITDITLSAHGEESDHAAPTVHTQAVLLWSAGPLDIRRYEKSVKTLGQTRSASTRDGS